MERVRQRRWVTTTVNLSKTCHILVWCSVVQVKISGLFLSPLEHLLILLSALDWVRGAVGVNTCVRNIPCLFAIEAGW